MNQKHEKMAESKCCLRILYSVKILIQGTLRQNPPLDRRSGKVILQKGTHTGMGGI